MVNMAAEEQGLYGGGSAAGSVCTSEDEISVGCPSPGAGGESHRGDGGSSSGGEEDSQHEERGDDYFKPLKRLKMMKIEQVSYSIGSGKKSGKRARPFARRQSTGSSNGSGSGGVKSFSILDILNHRPAGAVSPTPVVPPRGIVRPWDEAAAAAAVAVASAPPTTLLLPPPPLLFTRPQSAETYETCSSGRSSTGGSDCCTSPDIMPSRPRHHPHHNHHQHHPHSPHRQHHHHHHPGQHHSGQGLASRKHGGNKSEASPLDALFQMTSKTFEELNGESQEGQGSHMNMFSNRTQPKKKRKSRTAFTNHQIFELEKRFLYQKYLSPADRDEIAAQLGLSNAQVITWFQNRRAKLKRDMEELKKDVETAKVFVTQKSFLESVHSFSMLKKKPIASDDDKNVEK